MPTYVIEFGKFARIEGGDARGIGGKLVTRKRGDLIELTLEQAAEKHSSVRLATAEEIAAGRALSLERNPLPLPQPVDPPPAPEPAAPVEPIAPPAPPELVDPPPPTLPATPPATAGDENTPKARSTKKTTGAKKTAGKKK